MVVFGEALSDPSLYRVSGGGIANHGAMVIEDSEVANCNGYHGGGILNFGSMSLLALRSNRVMPGRRRMEEGF